MDQKFTISLHPAEHAMTCDAVIDMEGRKFKFISNSDDSPIQVILSTTTRRIATFATDYPLSPVILYLKKIGEDSNLSNPETIDDAIKLHVNNLDHLLNEALLKFQKNEKITIKGNEMAETLIDAVELMNELIDAAIKNCPKETDLKHKVMCDLALKSQNLMLNFCLDLKKRLIIKNKKTKLNEAIDDFIVNSLTALQFLYLSNGYFHQAEIHANHAMTLLGKMKDQKRIDQLSLSLKFCLAEIYFEFGYFEATLNLIKKSQEIIKKKHLPDFNIQFSSLLTFLIEKALPFYQTKNNLVALEICENSLALANLVIQKYPKFSETIIKIHATINTIFSNAQKKYLADLAASMKASSAIKKMLSKIQHNFNQHSLLIIPKTQEYTKALSHILRSFGIQTEIIAGQQIKVDLYHCGPQLLAEACEKSLTVIEGKTQLAKLREPANSSSVQSKSTISDKSPSAPSSVGQMKTTSMTFFSEKEQATTSPTQTSEKFDKNLTTLTKSIAKPSVTAAKSDNNSLEKPCITYYWPKTGLTYDSKESNQGTVKMLASEDGFVPEGIYFGYIPNYILDDAHYHLGFTEKLTSGKIAKHCIRRIAKEMQNLGKSECFLFKIVISKNDPRLYAWIEDIYVDTEGKQHFLLCFGLISNHKLKNLPSNPQKLKDKMMKKHQNIKTITQQVFHEDIVKKFLNSFVEIIYGETIGIPEQMKIALQVFLNELTNSAYLAQKELDSTQTKLLFSDLSEMNSLLLKLGKQTGNPTEELATIQEILEVLSKLESQKIYWPIVNPLLEIIKNTEDYYITELKKSSSSSSSFLNDTEKKSSDDQTAEKLSTQIHQTSEQIKTTLSELEKNQPTETSTEKREKENTSSNSKGFGLS